MSEWKITILDNICDMFTGFPFKSKYYEDKGKFNVVRGDNIKEKYIKWDEKRKCWNEMEEELKQYKLTENDIVIGMDGSKVGLNRAMIFKEDLPALLAQRCTCVRAKDNFDQNFIKYHIFSKNFKSYVDSVKTGTSIPHISLKQIQEYPLEIPTYVTQKKIGFILSKIDEKIIVNMKINNKLSLKNNYFCFDFYKYYYEV